MNRYIKYFIFFILIFLLISVRIFEKQFFNDGLIDFFDNNYQSGNLPDIVFWDSFKIILIRYFINAVLSIAILYMLFKQKQLISFLFVVYFSFLLIISILFYYEWNNYQAGEYLYLFYIRRFLIQPLLLFLLIPALIYQNKKQS